MSNDTQPEIRFPEFTDEWEQRKLGDESDVRDGTHDSPKYYDKGYPLVTSKNLKDFGLDLSNVSFISDEDFEVINKRSKVDIGDILFGMIGTIGNPVLVDRADFAIKNVALIKEQKKILNSFLIQILKSPVFDKYIKNENAGGTQKFLSLSKVRDFNFLCPNIDEQNCISAFFKKLDDTIALHQRKLDLLKETKKGFLQKMFPKNGAKVPEIRFPGFTGDWEERKLGEVVVFLNGRAFKQQELLDSGKYRVLRVGNFNTNDRWYYSNLELEEDKYANKGDLLYLWATSFGPEMWNEERVIYHYHIWKLKFLSKELDKQYLYTWLLTDKEKIKESTNGTTMVHVTKGGIEQRTFQFPPDINEQQKIGAFFKQLDDTIALHQRKLDLLKETKKGFLQKMFV
ncbi:restriction endonuclease subunit S [Enterococcus avium]|uniref:restriction endonuclease subunit S n=4 Tax=Enterococcus TaxID=1350 RepID=UPI002E0EB672|nr:restriction endonuclease subunit S [Enterococcus avium]